jgi:hypothetical protein
VPDLTLQTRRNANVWSFVVKKLGIFAALLAVSIVLTLFAMRSDKAAVAPVAQDAAMPAKQAAPTDGCKLAGAIPDCEAVMARLRAGGTYGDSKAATPRFCYSTRHRSVSMKWPTMTDRRRAIGP